MMTIEQVTQRKTKLESDIAAVLQDFSQETGLSVDSDITVISEGPSEKWGYMVRTTVRL